MKLHNNYLDESLIANDLKWLVSSSVLIDLHKTKLGDEKDYIVMAIIVNDRKPAQDLASFIENSVYKFDDVEVSGATDTKGRYLIYVELIRSAAAFDTINGILNDVKKLTGIDQLKFKGMGMHDSVNFDKETFSAYVIVDPLEYDLKHPKVEKTDATQSDTVSKQEAVRESIKNRLKFLMNY